MTIIDRRPNPGQKSLPNRQRFLERAKGEVRKAMSDSLVQRKVGDSGDAQVTITNSGTSEPQFHHAPGGDTDYVVSGNPQYVKGDQIERPKSGGGPGSQGSETGSGVDAFEFTLTREEFLDLFFEDLALPELVKTALLDLSSTQPQRAGFSTTGSASALNLGRTMRKSVARRAGLRRPADTDIQALLEAVDRAVADGDAEQILLARAELEEALRRTSAVPWIDPLDLVYNRFAVVPKPTAGAVMFCLMDVSGSMTAPMKDLAKRFFVLLHIFLQRRYARVEVVFIRHTEVAEEVDEHTFFHDPRTGGTLVSSALVAMTRIQRARFPSAEWNIYGAQASDGDNTVSDAKATLACMTQDILPMVQYFAYIETHTGHGDRITDLWRSYAAVDAGSPSKLALRKVFKPADIWSVFSDLFARDRAARDTQQV